MAIICPQCGEIHFDTTAAPTPTHCRKCESDLNGVSGLMPKLSADGSFGSDAPRSRAGTSWVVIGLVLLAVSGGCWWYGMDRYTKAKKTLATVVQVAGLSQGTSGGPSKGQIRGTVTATYKVNGKTYYQYPGVRGGDTSFDVYYLPGQPADASEEPPFAFLLAAGILTKIGLILLIRGVFKFSVTRARESDHRRVMGNAA